MDEIDKFLKKYSLPKLTEETEKLNSLIANKETDDINKNLHTRKLRPGWSHQWTLPNIYGKK